MVKIKNLNGWANIQKSNLKSNNHTYLQYVQVLL